MVLIPVNYTIVPREKNSSDLQHLLTVESIIKSNYPEYLMLLVTLLVQLIFIKWLWERRNWKSFPTILLFATTLTVIVQRLLPFSEIPLLPYFSHHRFSAQPAMIHPLEPIWCKIWLYVDFYAYFFYFSVWFAIILHRSFRNHDSKWRREVVLLVLCVAFSVAGTVRSIEMGGIKKSVFEVPEITGRNSSYETRFTYICVLVSLVSLMWSNVLNALGGFRSMKDFDTVLMSIIYGGILVLNVGGFSKKYPAMNRFYKEHMDGVHCLAAILVPLVFIWHWRKGEERANRS